MTTTKERIEADIKKNAMPQIEEYATNFAKEIIEPNILEQAQDCAGRKLTNLSTAGTKAGDSEMARAVQSIEQKMAKAIVAELRKIYNL